PPRLVRLDGMLGPRPRLRRLDDRDVASVVIAWRARIRGDRIAGLARHLVLHPGLDVARPRWRRWLRGRDRSLRRRLACAQRLHLVLELDGLSSREQHPPRQRAVSLEEQRYLVFPGF